jgi:hypothetical protein
MRRQKYRQSVDRDKPSKGLCADAWLALFHVEQRRAPVGRRPFAVIIRPMRAGGFGSFIGLSFCRSRRRGVVILRARRWARLRLSHFTSGAID